MDDLAKSYMQQCIEGLVLIGKLRDLNEELYAALQTLLDRYVQAIGNEGPECYAARAALAKARP